MKVLTGHLYHIKDEFFDRIKNGGLMINHENGHSRPAYLAIKDKDILWFIPLSSKIKKYKKIIDEKVVKYGTCKTILIKKIADQEQVILIQNAFPTLEKYIDHVHTVNGAPARVGTLLKQEILDNFEYLMKLHNRGIKVFFTDIDKLKEKLIKELN